MSDPKGKGKATGVDLNDPILSSMVDATGKPIAPVVLKDFKEVGDKDLEALVKSITDGEVNKIIKAVEGITEKDMTALEFSIFDFVGFDPFMVSKVLAFYQKHYNDTQENLLSDIRFSIAACLYMGNLQYKSLSRRALEGRSKIEYLARKYGIRTGSHGTGIPATALTFPRIAAAYPALAVRMAAKLPPKTVNLDFKSALAPPYIRLTSFGSLCSVTMPQDLRLFLLEACNSYGADMAIAYERGRKKAKHLEVKYDPIAIAHDQWAFMEVASNSPVPDEETRKGLLTSLNMTSDYNKLAELVANYRSIVEKKPLADVKVMSSGEFSDSLGSYLSG